MAFNINVLGMESHSTFYRNDIPTQQQKQHQSKNSFFNSKDQKKFSYINEQKKIDQKKSMNLQDFKLLLRDKNLMQQINQNLIKYFNNEFKNLNQQKIQQFFIEGQDDEDFQIEKFILIEKVIEEHGIILEFNEHNIVYNINIILNQFLNNYDKTKNCDENLIMFKKNINNGTTKNIIYLNQPALIEVSPLKQEDEDKEENSLQSEHYDSDDEDNKKQPSENSLQSEHYDSDDEDNKKQLLKKDKTIDQQQYKNKEEESKKDEREFKKNTISYETEKQKEIYEIIKNKFFSNERIFNKFIEIYKKILQENQLKSRQLTFDKKFDKKRYND